MPAMRQAALQRHLAGRRGDRGDAGKPEGGERRRRLLPALSIVRRPRCDGAAGAWRTRRVATARLVWLAAAAPVEQTPEVLERQQVHVDAREDALVHEVLELRGVQVL